MFASMPQDAPLPSASGSERLLVLLGYGLFLIAPMGGLSALLAVVIAHLRVAQASGTVQESHYRNQIRVFWTMLVYVLLMLALFALAMGFSAFSLLWPFSPGWPFWPAMMAGAGWTMLLATAGFLSLMLVVWFYWRLLRGFLRALDDRPY